MEYAVIFLGVSNVVLAYLFWRVCDLIHEEIKDTQRRFDMINTALDLHHQVINMVAIETFEWRQEQMNETRRLH